MEIEVAKIQMAIEEFKSLNTAYNSYLEYSETPSKDGLSSYATKYNNIYSELVLIKPYFWKLRTLHDDKRATSIKSRLAHSIHANEKSYAKSETLAYASDDYKRFLDDRADYYEFYMTVEELQNAIDNRLKEITQRFYTVSNTPNLV